MGVVYKAIDTRLDRPVALKVMSINLEPTLREQFAARLQQEARSAARLNHPNIITIYECERVNDLPYIAMEFVDGPSLADMQDGGKKMPIDKVLKILRQLLKGLAYAHQNDIVHRDIKPGNLMFTSTGMLKITDFGIAQMPTSDLTQTGTPLGSPRYMSPEQVSAKRVDGRSDIFSCGVVLYELLTGTEPFNADNVASIVYKILFETPTAPAAICPEIPIWLSDLTMICLAKDPDQRFQSAEAMLEALRHGLRERDAEELAAHTHNVVDTQTPRTTPTPAAASGKNHRAGVNKPWAIWGGVLVVCGLVAVGVGLWLSTHLQPVEPPTPTPQVSGTQPATMNPQANWKQGGAATLVTPPPAAEPEPVPPVEVDPALSAADPLAAAAGGAAVAGTQLKSDRPMTDAERATKVTKKPPKELRTGRGETSSTLPQHASTPDRDPEAAPAPPPRPVEQPKRASGNDNKSFWTKQMECVRDGKCEAPVQQRTKRDR